MEDDELALFAGTVTRATDTASGEALDRALEDLGWRDALAADRRAAISLLFDAAGRANATSSALEWLLADALGVAPDTAVVLPRFRTSSPPGLVQSGRCAVSGLGAAALRDHSKALVVATTGEGSVALDVPVDALALRPVAGIDPALGLLDVSGDVEAGPSSHPISPSEWDGAIALGQLALSHELIGAARTMLELARQHATERVQFGRPIAMFQAVRHRLADSLVAIEAADSLLAGAWEEPTPVLAAMAKGMAGRGARTAAKHCQQVLAGIGFTAEHPFHRFYRRVVVLDQLLGAGSVLTRQLGTDVLATGTLPPAFTL
jgi:Acyl-CoA dehydrogenase, C-terminal domain